MPDPLNDLFGRSSNNAGFNYGNYNSIPNDPAYGQTDAEDSDLTKHNNKNLGFVDNEQKSGIRDTKILDPDALAERLRMRELLEDAEREELWDYHNDSLLKKAVIGLLIYYVA